jgi:hypothetical protein
MSAYELYRPTYFKRRQTLRSTCQSGQSARLLRIFSTEHVNSKRQCSNIVGVTGYQMYTSSEYKTVYTLCMNSLNCVLETDTKQRWD